MDSFFSGKRAGLINWIFTFLLTIFGILTSIFSGDWNKWVCLVVIVLLGIFPAIYAIKGFTSNANLRDTYKKAVLLKQVLQKELNNVSAHDSKTISYINEAIKQIKSGKLVIEPEWGYEARCNEICEQIFTSVRKYSDCEEVKIQISMKTDDKVKILCYNNSDQEKPDRFDVSREISLSPTTYCDEKYFLKYKNSNPVIEVSSDHKITAHDFTNGDSYEQYIFVPIKILDSGGGLIGLVQAVSKIGNKMAEDDAGLMEIANNVIVPYATAIALMYNIECVMKARPEDEHGEK